MKKFEYDMLEIQLGRYGEDYWFKGIRYPRDFWSVLNMLGDDGWQLSGQRNGGHYIMMREVVQDDSDN